VSGWGWGFPTDPKNQANPNSKLFLNFGFLEDFFTLFSNFRTICFS